MEAGPPPMTAKQPADPEILDSVDILDNFKTPIMSPRSPVSRTTTPTSLTLAEQLAAETLESRKRAELLFQRREPGQFARPLTPIATLAGPRPIAPKPEKGQKKGNKRGKAGKVRKDVMDGVDFTAARPVADLLGDGVDLNAPENAHNRAAYFKYAKNGRLDDDDVRSIVSVANSTASTASTTYHRFRAQEVKAKVEALPKDEEGQVIIDKTNFSLADIIYLNRHTGRKKTGLQVKREEYENRLAKAKLEKKQQMEAEKREVELEKGGILQEPMSVPSKIEVGSTIGSTIGSMVDNSDLKSRISDSSAPPTMVKNQAPTKFEAPEIPLTQDQITQQNRYSADKVKVLVNEKGELIVDQIQSSLEHPSIKKSDECERDIEDEVTNMKSYKRCYQRKSSGRARRWREFETNLFWEALGVVGQDFTLMEWYFKQKKVLRNKSELRTKFHREDKLEPRRVNACLHDARLRPLNMRDFFGAEESPSGSIVDAAVDGGTVASSPASVMVGGEP